MYYFLATLSTTIRTRSKSSSLPPNIRAHSAPNHNNQIPNQIIDNSSSSSPSTLIVPNLRKTNKSIKQQPRPKSSVINGHNSGLITDDQHTSSTNKVRDKNIAESK